MPVYEYSCLSCKHRFELRRPMRESSSDAECPECGAKSERKFSSPQFMGFRDTNYDHASFLATGYDK